MKLLNCYADRDKYIGEPVGKIANCQTKEEAKAFLNEFLINNKVGPQNVVSDPFLENIKTPEVAKAFIEMGFDIHGKNSEGGFNALFFASSTEIASEFIKAGCDINQIGLNNRTPLYSQKNARMVEYYIENGADIYKKDFFESFLLKMMLVCEN